MNLRRLMESFGIGEWLSRLPWIRVFLPRYVKVTRETLIRFPTEYDKIVIPYLKANSPFTRMVEKTQIALDNQGSSPLKSFTEDTPTRSATMKNEQFELQEAAKRSAETEMADCRSGSSRQAAHVRGFLAGAKAARPEVVEQLLEALLAWDAGEFSSRNDLLVGMLAYRASIAPPPVGHDAKWALNEVQNGRPVHHETWYKGWKVTQLIEFTPDTINGNGWHSGPKL